MPRRRSTSRAGSSPIVVVTAADNRFVLALAVMVRSLIENLAPGKRLAVYILDAGIRAANRRKLLASWDLQRARVVWLKTPRKRLQGLPDLPWYGLSIYNRLLAADLLPRRVRRMLYLDADVLILDDVSRLWRTSLQGKILGAVQDVGFMLLEEANLPMDGREVPPSSKYFNSGVLLLDLDRWRRENCTEETLLYLRNHRARVAFPDQDALNVVCAGQWRELPMRWNCSLHASLSRLPSLSLEEQVDHSEAVARPGILHFMGTPKPWEKGCTHRRVFLWHYYLDRTRWCGWRPE